jgi:hypothetical protein
VLLLLAALDEAPLLIERQKLNNDDDVDIAVLLYYLAQKNGR